MKYLNFSDSLKITSFTYFLTSFFGLILYYEIFTFFSVEVIGQYSLYQSLLFLGSRYVSLSTPYSLMKVISSNQNKNINLTILFSTFFITAVFYLLNVSIFSIKSINSMLIKLPFYDVIKLLSFSILIYSFNLLIKSFFNSYKDILFYNFSFFMRTPLSIFYIFIYFKEVIDNFYTIFLFTEITLFILNLTIIIFRRNLFKIHNFKQELIVQLKYIRTSFLSGWFSETFFKIDIYCVAVFFDAYFTGIYSLVVIFGEGLLGLIYTIRNIITPHLTTKAILGNGEEISKILKSSFKLTNFISFFTSSIIILFIYFGSNYFSLLKPLKQEGLLTLAIILFGFSFISFLFSIENLLLQTNLQGLHTIGLLVLTFSNLLFNNLLIEYNLKGIAFSTLISCCLFFIIILKSFNYNFKFSFIKRFLI